MDILSFILVLIAIAIGFWFGKYLTERTNWHDKKKAIDAEWQLQIQKIQSQNNENLLKFQKISEAQLKEMAHGWEIKYTTDLAEIKELVQSAEKYLRYDAVKRSKRTLLGKLWEQVSPYIPKFPFRPSDMKFLGSPIDFIIFDGASENDIKKIIFLEIKSGDSKLSAQERKLKSVIENGKVEYKIFNVDKPTAMKVQEDEEAEEIVDEIKPAALYSHIDEKIAEVSEGDDSADSQEDDSDNDSEDDENK